MLRKSLSLQERNYFFCLEAVFLKFDTLGEKLMCREFIRWESINFERYLFFKKVVLENEFSHIICCQITIILWPVFLQFIYTYPVDAVLYKINNIKVKHFWWSIYFLSEF